jgi:DNA primase large subunit
MRIKAMTLTKLPESIEITANEFKNKLPSPKIYMTPRSPDAKDYPPCIKHALEEMNNGINLPHSARLMLATYMLTVGKSVNEIVMLFQNAPDYNERITRYQVEHLAGIRGSHKKYSVPSCQKLRNESLCFAIEECNGITSPIQFGRLRVRKELSYDQQ